MRTSETAASKPPESTARRVTGAVWTALALVYVLWGSTYLAIRVVVRTMPPFLSAGARFIAAGLLLLGLVAWRYGPPRSGPPAPRSVLRSWSACC